MGLGSWDFPADAVDVAVEPFYSPVQFSGRADGGRRRPVIENGVDDLGGDAIPSCVVQRRLVVRRRGLRLTKNM